ncbi:hypothetical protein FOA43_004109 [Brettanomyces nanus]|uniref:Uncharacterized protein n=1 Tax=Eeniella nana TaxID=13502 RepID=A0A875S974_EENNA|nr:uncharacterized protein FOA43_004109 [Brettanomyces nanus]QPG76715.1 hypothetical protein FOA43_004109 [Brettanomyces nanus]
MPEVKKQEKILADSKAKINSNVARAITFLTVVPMNLIRLWYSRVPLLYLPNGLLPAFLEIFVLNFPLLSRGSIGVIVWSFCVSRVFNFFASFFKLIFFTEVVHKTPTTKID